MEKLIKEAKVEAKIEKPIEAKKVEAKPVKVKQIEQPKVLKFKNVGKGMKIKLVDGKKFKWITVKTGEVVSVSRKIAQRNKLVEVK